MADEPNSGWKEAIRRLGARIGTESKNHVQRLERPHRDQMPPDREGRTLLSRHFRKTKLPEYTELAVPGGHSVLLLSEYQFNKPQLDAIRHNFSRARKDVKYAIDALGKEQLDNKTSVLLKQHFGLAPDEIPWEHMDDISQTLLRISKGLDGPKVQIKLRDDLRKKHPDFSDKVAGAAALRFLKDDEQPPSVSMLLATEAAFAPEFGSRAIIHEAGHNVAGLRDHGARGYADVTEAGQPMRYREGGLTFSEALFNADTYAAFCCDMRRCPPTISWSLPSTESLHFQHKNSEGRSRDVMAGRDPAGQPVKTAGQATLSQYAGQSDASGRSRNLDERTRSPVHR